MALQSSGQIDFSDIQAEFGGTAPAKLSMYYKGGALVPNITNNVKVPTSNQIKLSDFYGAVQFVPKMYELTLDVAMNIDGSDYFWFGWYNVGEPSAPYSKVTHRNFQNGWGFTCSWKLIEKQCTNFSDTLRSSSYGIINGTTTGSVGLLYSNVKLPFNIPKFDHVDYVAPDPVLGYTMQPSKVMIQLINPGGRVTKDFHQTQSGLNNYTTVIIVSDDLSESWVPANFTLVYRWLQLVP
jgi:hypothetical protein